MLSSYVRSGAGSRGSCVKEEQWTWINGVVVVKIDEADADVGR